MDKNKIITISTAFSGASLSFLKIIFRMVKKEKLSLEEQVKVGKEAERKLKESGLYEPDSSELEKKIQDYICNLVKDAINASIITSTSLSHYTEEDEDNTLLNKLKIISKMYGYDNIAVTSSQNGDEVTVSILKDGDTIQKKKFVLRQISINGNSYTLFV